MVNIRTAQRSVLQGLTAYVGAIVMALLFLVGCTAKGAGGSGPNASVAHSSQVDLGTNWRLAPNPCNLFGTEGKIDLGDNAPILKKTRESHLEALGQRLCYWSGGKFHITVSILTHRSTFPHYELTVDLANGVHHNIGLAGAETVWNTYPDGNGGIAESVYGNVKIVIVIIGSLEAEQKQALLTMLAGALETANRTG